MLFEEFVKEYGSKEEGILETFINFNKIIYSLYVIEMKILNRNVDGGLLKLKTQDLSTIGIPLNNEELELNSFHDEDGIFLFFNEKIIFKFSYGK